MKSEIWPDVGMPEMTDWLAELRDDGGAEQPGDGHAAQAAADDPVPEAPAPEVPAPAPIPEASALAPIPEAPAAAQANRPIPADQASGPVEPWPPGWAWTRASADTPAETSPSGWIKAPVGKHAATKRADAPAKVTEPAAPEITEPAEIKEITERAVIGDELRRPITWCEMDSCISWHADPAALGEVDNRARAIHAGWRVDALGRMACPRCLQTASGYRSSRPVVPWDRYTAIAMAGRPAVRRDRTIGAARGNSRVPAARAAAVNPPGRRSGDDTASTRPPAPFLPAGRHAERQPAPPFPQRGADRGPDPANLRYGRTAPGRPVSRERA